MARTVRTIFASKTVGAELFLWKPDCGYKIINSLERKRCEIELLADKLYHAFVGLAVRIGVLRDVSTLTLVPTNITTGDEVVFALRPRIINELARIQQRGTGNTDVHLLASLLIKPVRLLA